MRYRERRTVEWEEVASGGTIALDAERTWQLEGSVSEVAAVGASLGPRIAESITPTLVHLRFGNAVGVFRTRAGINFEVSSGKWNVAHFDAMLSDIAAICANLPFAPGEGGALPYAQAEQTRELADYHSFVYLRYILSATCPDGDRLAPAVEHVLRDPHRRLVSERETVAIERATTIDAASIRAVCTSRTLQRVHGRAAGFGLARALGGHLPTSLDQRRSERHVDSLENRFVHAFLEDALRRVERVNVRVATKRDPLRGRVLADCDEMQRTLSPWLRHPLWRDVGQMRQLPLGSTVLQGRRGYRDVLRHYVRLMHGVEVLPLSAAQTHDLLESRDIATMYELWTYFVVVRELESLLGPPQRAVRTETHFWGADLRRGFEVRWASGYRCSYNETFEGRQPSRSYSLDMRPDVTIACPDGTLHVLDAKFKVDRSTPHADGSYKQEDIHKMHAYRDAIAKVRSAWVMYPGDVLETFSATTEMAHDGVGALPLRPDANAPADLRALVAGLV